jgi:sulfide:quinone oxidoreductase
MASPPRILILGAGFAGLELATTLSDELGVDAQITLIDRADAFVFGYSKLDVLFGRAPLDAVQLPYSAFAKPGVRLLKETIVAIDPAARRVSTDAAVHEADHLVIALGADYDLDATPGLGDGDNEFYSVAGAVRMAELLPSFTKGRAVIGVCGTPFKCPPAPSECALLLHDRLTALGVRGDCEIEFVIPFNTPVPPSPDTSAALVQAFAERDIVFRPGRRPVALDTAARVVTLDDGGELSYDIFFGVPKHRAPDVVIDSGMVKDGYIPVASDTLRTRFPNVYACGDCATVGVPKAGVFAEGAARVVARELIAELRGERPPAAYEGRGSCYIEFGAGRVGRVDVDFLSGPEPTGTYRPPSTELVAEKERFGSSRRARWFGV